MSKHQHVFNKHGKFIPQHQYSDMPQMKHETVIIPSTSAPAWGGYFIFDIREKNVRIHDIAIQFNASALTGYTVATGAPTYLQRYTPAVFWATRIEIVQNNNVIDTIYPNEQFLMQQLFNPDERRALINAAEGSYSSIPQRVTLASSASSYYVDLSTFFSQTHQALYHSKDDIQIRVYMDTLANNAVAPSGGTFTLSSSTPVSTINSANVIVKLSRESAEYASANMHLIRSRAHHFPFTELRFGTFVVNSGTASTSIVLTPITGNVTLLLFTVRPIASISGEGYYNYTAISNFAILDSTSTNIVGGQALPSSLNLLIMANNWFKSSYTNETSAGFGTNNGANVYSFSFGADPISTMESSVFLNSTRFTGNEQLQIQFNGTLGANVQVDVYAFVESYVEITHNSVRKIQ
jgi:hypothetical protein